MMWAEFATQVVANGLSEEGIGPTDEVTVPGLVLVAQICLDAANKLQRGEALTLPGPEGVTPLPPDAPLIGL